MNVRSRRKSRRVVKPAKPAKPKTKKAQPAKTTKTTKKPKAAKAKATARRRRAKPTASRRGSRAASQPRRQPAPGPRPAAAVATPAAAPTPLPSATLRKPPVQASHPVAAKLAPAAGQGDTLGPPPPRPRGRPRVDDKRRIILDAALRAFAERGYHGTAVPEVGQAAGVGTGTLYRYFASKEYLVNEVFRDAKERLRDALLVDLANLDLRRPKDAQHWFQTLWQRLGDFAKREPDAFRFLEMQDHVAYLDADSRHLELAVLDPLWVAGKQLRDRTVGPPVDVSIALLWGAFVGLVKASRLGYLALDDKRLADAGDACWRMIVSARRRPSRRKARKH